MSDKWIVFKNVDELNYLSEFKPYKVKEENCSCYKIKGDDGCTVNVYKTISHTYDYEVFEKYQLPDNISYWKPTTDNVTSPSHYNQGDIETIDYINQIVQAYNGRAGYHVGNVIKYVSRAPHKNGKEDLEKAKVYLEWAIEHFEG